MQAHIPIAVETFHIMWLLENSTVYSWENRFKKATSISVLLQNSLTLWTLLKGLQGSLNALWEPLITWVFEPQLGEGNGNPLQYSCLENPMDRGACPWGQKELDMTKRHVCLFVWAFQKRQNGWVHEFPPPPRHLSIEQLTLKNALFLKIVYIWILDSSACEYGDFPGGLMVKNLHFHCWGPAFDPWSGN